MVYEDGRKQFVPLGPVKLTFPILANRDGIKGTVVGKPKFKFKTDEATREAISSLMEAMVQDALKTPCLFDRPLRTVGYGCPPWSEKK